MKKRFLSTLLALCMVLTLLPGTALASGSYGVRPADGNLGYPDGIYYMYGGISDDIVQLISPTALYLYIAPGQAAVTAEVFISFPINASDIDAKFVQNNLELQTNSQWLTGEISGVSFYSTNCYRINLRFDTSKLSQLNDIYSEFFVLYFAPSLAYYMGAENGQIETLPLPVTVTVRGGNICEVWFNPNGGTAIKPSDSTTPYYDVDRDGATLETSTDTDCKLYVMPQAVRSGYDFDGWYTASAGGTRVSVGMDLSAYQGNGGKNWSDDQIVLWAHWSETPLGGRMMVFCPNGGTITAINGHSRDELLKIYDYDGMGFGIEQVTKAALIRTNASGKLPCFPTAAREGYVFDGWYAVPENKIPLSIQGWDAEPEFMTDFGSYQKASLSTVYADRSYFVARWTKGDAYTVTFNLNGAPGIAPDALNVSKTNGVMTLPKDPVWEGHTFQGWVSGDIVGNTITNLVWWNNGDKVTRDLTLYAAWAEGGSSDGLKGLTYRFSNSKNAFGYSNGYKIPLSRYQMVFGDTALAMMLYNSAGEWDGSCYAMAATAGMFFQDGDVPESSFRRGAEVPYDLFVGDKNSSLNLTLTEYIEAVFVSQYTDAIQADYSSAADLNSLCDAVTSFKKTGKNAPMIAIWGAEGGHAVLGYDVVDVSSTEAHLMIYDPNFPNTERYITLGKSNGKYVSWSYMMNNSHSWGTGHPDNNINYVPYSDYTQAWLNRAKMKNTTSSAALLSVDVENISITNNTDAVVATLQNGKLTTTNPNIHLVHAIGLTSDSARTSAGTLLSLPVGEYTVTNTGSEDAFTVTMVDVDQSATVTTTSSSITFLVDDSKAANLVQVSGSSKSYGITLSSTLDQGYKEVILTGTTSAETTAAAQVSGKLYGTNLDTKGTIKADGKIVGSNILTGTVADADIASAQGSKTSPFTDVEPGAYYYDAVLWAVKNGVTTGSSDTTFSPNADCTRAQIVTFLWRAYGSPEPKSTINPFSDVKDSDYYYKAVLWAVENEVTGGTSSTTFSPNNACTRAQAMTFLYRAAGSPTVSDVGGFDDVDPGAYYSDAVVWAVANNITNGTAATTFSPGNICTRAQIVTFLWRNLAG